MTKVQEESVGRGEETRDSPEIVGREVARISVGAKDAVGVAVLE